MKIIIDAMGGDNAPSQPVRGAVQAVREFGCHIMLVGDEAVVRRELETAGGYDLIGNAIEIVHAPQVLTMEDDPFDVLRKKRNSSMTLALRKLANGEGDALVSAGNTGALFTGATAIVRAFRGVRRAAIATVLPFSRPLLLLDSGANATVTAEYLEQFAYMGEVYMRGVMHIPSPQVGLLNNGTEEHKGPPVYAECYQLLKNSDLDFVGNIEGKDIPKGKCDVLVADGFAGNVTLKLIEGMTKFLMKRIKAMFFANMATKMSAVLFKKQFDDMKREFDTSEYGGAPFLGISRPVIKAHGSSDARAIKNAVRQSIAYLESGISEEIAEWAQTYVHTEGEKPEDAEEQTTKKESDHEQ